MRKIVNKEKEGIMYFENSFSKEKRRDFSYALFLISTFFLLIRFFLSSLLFSEKISIFLDCIGFGSIVLYFFSFLLLLSDMSFKRFFYSLLIITLGLLSTYIVKEYTLFFTLIFTISASNFEFNNVLKYVHKIKLFFLIFITFASLLLLSFGVLKFVEDGGKNTFSFGFSHRNIFSGNVLWLIIESFYLRKKINYKFYLISMLISLFVYIFTKSDIYLVIIVILIILSLFFKYLKMSSLVKKNIGFSFIAFGIFIMIAIFSIKDRTSISSFFLYLDDLVFNSRLKLAAKTFELSGQSFFSFFGFKTIRGEIERDQYYGLTSLTIDGLYISLLLQYGFVWLLFFSFLFYKTAVKGNSKVNIVLFCFAVYSLAEMHCLDALFSFPTTLILLSIVGIQRESMKRIKYDT